MHSGSISKPGRNDLDFLFLAGSYIGFNIVFMVLITGLAIYLIINPIPHQFFHIILQH